MPNTRSFAACVYFNHKIYVFGGYDQTQKLQLCSNLVYDIHNDKWNHLPDMRSIKSQAAACKINDHEIAIFGGYNKEKGTLDSIERYSIQETRLI